MGVRYIGNIGPLGYMHIDKTCAESYCTEMNWFQYFVENISSAYKKI